MRPVASRRNGLSARQDCDPDLLKSPSKGPGGAFARSARVYIRCSRPYIADENKMRFVKPYAGRT
jgi:hypothetical protein